MGYIAFGIFLLIIGAALLMSGVPILFWAGWSCLALAAILIVVQLAVGPQRPGSLTRRA